MKYRYLLIILAWVVCGCGGGFATDSNTSTDLSDELFNPEDKDGPEEQN
ncbi:MAG: hypothetical protein GF398_08045 [Chitinivibrionales bacterium]|nr:hypothetical protein [Chitinivibrionales bacterium]